MSKYEIDKETELKLKTEADEYSKSYAFGFDKQDMEYRLKAEGLEVPDDEKLNEMVKEEYIEKGKGRSIVKKTDMTGKKQTLILKTVHQILIVNVAENITPYIGCRINTRME